MNRRIINNCHVIHEGLCNSPVIKNKLIELANKLLSDSENTESHLADIGLSVSFTVAELQKLVDDIFKKHAFEKKNGII